MAHQRKLIRQAAVATLIAANTAAAARVKATRIEPHKKGQLPALAVYALSEAVVDEVSRQSAPREITRDLKLEIAGWVAHTDSNPVDDRMDDLAEQIEAAMDANRYINAALVVSAADHVTGQLTVPGHGLNTGSWPLLVVPAIGGVSPTGISPTVEFAAIVIDANTIKLATSSSNALAGAAIAFTDNGTLPLRLLVSMAADSILTGTVMEVVEDDGGSDPLVGIVTLTYSVTYRTSPAATASFGDFNTLDAKYPLVGGVASTLVPEDTVQENP